MTGENSRPIVLRMSYSEEYDPRLSGWLYRFFVHAIRFDTEFVRYAFPQHRASFVIAEDVPGGPMRESLLLLAMEKTANEINESLNSFAEWCGIPERFKVVCDPLKTYV